MQLPVPRSHVADVYSSSVQGPPSLASCESNSGSESIQASANDLRGDTQETSGASRERDDPYWEDDSGGGHVCIRAKEEKMEKSESEAPAKEKSQQDILQAFFQSLLDARDVELSNATAGQTNQLGSARNEHSAPAPASPASPGWRPLPPTPAPAPVPDGPEPRGSFNPEYSVISSASHRAPTRAIQQFMTAAENLPFNGDDDATTSEDGDVIHIVLRSTVQSRDPLTQMSLGGQVPPAVMH
ncbi:hypothetical protein SISSUDRAFT_1046925 [Sistotremastrum suecicum HHB10207 ss-3]|uniref:Uncharacterized protein n=1 Tax=Sistotremastrum suecicum HHB10207 ss-3 TaxID=1314776 RepID=A0A166DGD6_9AGAM|nr:hypothetical protein SISSUDRAFT_1046925 [Sistotremastrum suecicum HHB10207 ss-3]